MLPEAIGGLDPLCLDRRGTFVTAKVTTLPVWNLQLSSSTATGLGAAPDYGISCAQYLSLVTR